MKKQFRNQRPHGGNMFANVNNETTIGANTEMKAAATTRDKDKAGKGIMSHT